MSKIGAEVSWVDSSNTVYNNFAKTGDWMTNSRPALESVINAGVRTIIYDGDAVRAFPSDEFSSIVLTQVVFVQDYILNYMGVEAVVSHDT